MTRLLVHVEGQTEEEFVRSVLAPHLFNRGFTGVSARLNGNARARKKRGGTCPWSSVRSEIGKHLTSDQQAFGTTIVDYYALPANGDKAWPGRAGCDGLSVEAKASRIQEALREDFTHHYGPVAHRFIPYVVMYEFEGLLFSAPDAMARGMGQSAFAGEFQAIRDQFETPEHINDSPITAPSKRVQAIIHRYNKVVHGVAAANEVSLDVMRAECPSFASWLASLEALPPGP